MTLTIRAGRADVHRVSPVTSRCPRCGAACTADAGWCPLCFADLQPPRSRAVPDPQPPRSSAPGPSASAPVTTPPPDAAQVDAMLAALSVETRAPSGDLVSRLRTPGARVAVMALGTVLMAVVGFLLLTLLGALVG